MPKRPCAVAITGDDAHIICGDKFGDVYALPLLESSQTTSAQQSPQASELEPASGNSADGLPSPADETVHTAHNKRAREQQLRNTAKPPARTAPKSDFHGQLLLGHVSMLTDLAVASAQSPTSGQARNYIISCDRDEHIRVSRGLPQSHVIENYCLGHQDFVSRLLIPDSCPDILISGGGDEALHVWDWQSGTLRQTADVLGLVKEAMISDMSQNPPSNGVEAGAEADTAEDGHKAEERLNNDGVTNPASAARSPGPSAAESTATRVAVSGLWAYRNKSPANLDDVRSEISNILVACEG